MPVSETASKVRKSRFYGRRFGRAALKELNVGAQDITQIVDRRVVEAAQLIRKIAKE